MSADDPKRWCDVRDGYWFAPKLFGWGAMPVTWQGSALTIGFVVLLILDINEWRSIPEAARIVIGVALVLAFMALCRRKPDGGWHWHWGMPK